MASQEQPNTIGQNNPLNNEEVSQWLRTIRGDENLQNIANTIEELRSLLQSEQPNIGELQDRLNATADELRLLSTRTNHKSDMHDTLGDIADALRRASVQLNQYTPGDQHAAQ